MYLRMGMNMSELKGASRAGLVVKSVAGLSLAVLLSACSMGSMFGDGPATTGSTGTLANAQAPQAQIDLNALATAPAIATECPPIKVRNGGEAVYVYNKGQNGNPRALQYQALIDKQSRSCVASAGVITVDMGMVGRLLLGPAGEAKQYTVPVRFAVERDDLVVYSEKFDLPVTVKPGEQSQEFYKVVDSVQIPFVGGENTVIWVGFDARG